jgi:hypothetical protein
MFFTLAVGQREQGRPTATHEVTNSNKGWWKPRRNNQTWTVYTGNFTNFLICQDY